MSERYGKKIDTAVLKIADTLKGFNYAELKLIKMELESLINRYSIFNPSD